MKKRFLLIGILVVTSLLVFQNCDFNPKDEEATTGWNDEPVYYLYSIKESIRPYVYIPDGYEAALANSLSDNDLAVLKFIVNKMTFILDIETFIRFQNILYPNIQTHGLLMPVFLFP
jgi:hypothetical protein